MENEQLLLRLKKLSKKDLELLTLLFVDGYGSALVPFINRFPRDTRLYALMTTKPGEGVFGGEEVPA